MTIMNKMLTYACTKGSKKITDWFIDVTAEEFKQTRWFPKVGENERYFYDWFVQEEKWVAWLRKKYTHPTLQDLLKGVNFQYSYAYYNAWNPSTFEPLNIASRSLRTVIEKRGGWYTFGYDWGECELCGHEGQTIWYPHYGMMLCLNPKCPMTKNKEVQNEKQ